MIGVDTNILVRFLVQDDEKQAQKVNALFSESEDNKQSLFVSTVVVLELMWVLRAAYEVPREAILHSLSELLSMSVLDFQDQKTVRDFIVSAENNTFDLSDLLIGQMAKDAGCDTTLTFDKKAGKSPCFTAY